MPKRTTKKIDRAFRAVTDPVAAVFVVRDPSNLLNDLNGAQRLNGLNATVDVVGAASLIA